MSPKDQATDTWFALKEAAAQLSVHPTTLRRWAKQGAIPYILTPGGHRRFAAADIQDFLDRRRAQPGIPVAQVWAERALTRTREGLAAQRSSPWMESMTADHRDQHRGLGRSLFGLTLQYISGEEENEDLLEEARAIGRQYGRLNKAAGMSLSTALAAAMFFRDELVEVALQIPDSARVRAKDNLRLMRRINQLLNAVHLAIAEIYDQSASDSGQEVLPAGS